MQLLKKTYNFLHMKKYGLEAHEGIAETALMIVTSTRCEASRSEAVA